MLARICRLFAGKRGVPSDAEPGDGSTGETSALARVESTDEQDDAIFDGDSLGDKYRGLLISGLRTNLQCVRNYRTAILGKGDAPYFELECLMQDGQWYWVAESDVQWSVPSAVGTFWGCGPEDWVAPAVGEKETGRQVWKRPLETDVDGVPDEFLIIGRETSRSGQTGFLMQKVGYPAAQPIWLDENTVKESWTHAYENHRSNYARDRDIPFREGAWLSAIVDHRLNVESSRRKRIQLSCQWTNGTETWESEDEVQRIYNAAVLTYWQSDPKARARCNIPDQRLRIIGHRSVGTNLLLKVQMVGGSLLEGCTEEPAEKLLLTWPGATKCFLETHFPPCYGGKPGSQRQSKRLRRRQRRTRQLRTRGPRSSRQPRV